jgi:hypothetical protein
MSRTLHRVLGTVLLGLGVLLITQTAGAAVLTWTFADVKFDDNGTLTGSFGFDANTGTYSNIDISVAGGNATFFPDFTYTGANSDVLSSSDDTHLSLVATFAAKDVRSLFMDFADSMTNAGGTIAVLNPAGLGGDSEFRTLSSSPPFGQRGFLPGGTIHAVPEPSSIWFLLALGLGVAAMSRRRRRDV